MTDIVERLRAFATQTNVSMPGYLADAADEIERLRGLLREARNAECSLGVADDLVTRIDAALAGTASQPPAVQLEGECPVCKAWVVLNSHKHDTFRLADNQPVAK